MEKSFHKLFENVCCEIRSSYTTLCDMLNCIKPNVCYVKYLYIFKLRNITCYYKWQYTYSHWYCTFAFYKSICISVSLNILKIYRVFNS